MVSKVLILALAIVQVAHASDMASMSPDEMLDFAQEIASKSTQEEQAVLKTLLGDRATWHPDALTLLDDIDARPIRRLGDNSTISHGRRLADQGIYCDGNDQASCEMMIDAQCNACKWDTTFNSCGVVKCSDYADQNTCCANAKNIMEGCRWQTGSGGKCVENTCSNVIGVYSDLADDAAKSAECSKNSACASMCSGGTSQAVCMPGKSTDYKCTCGKMSSSCTSADLDNMMQDTGLGGRRLASERLLFIDIGQKCTMTDCVKCLAPLGGMSGGSCGDKKKKVLEGGECYSKCKTLAHCAKEAECAFCGPKKGSACTAGTPLPSCAPITKNSSPPPKQSCAAQCDRAKKCESCESSKDKFECIDPNKPAGGAVQTAGSLSVMIGIFAATLYRLY